MDAQREEALIGYALGMLDADEQRAVEAEIAQDGKTRAAIDVWRQEIHRIGLAAPVIAPHPRVKQQLLARVRAGRRPATGTPLRLAERRARLTSLAWAAALALVIALGGWNITLRNENAALQESNATLARNLNVERARLSDRIARTDEAVRFLVSGTATARALSPTEAAPKAAGTMYMQPGSPTAVLVVSGLQPLPADRTYQFWLAREGEPPVPSDIFRVGADGSARIVIAADAQVNDFKQVMVTIEPAAGSSAPSDGAVVLAGNL